MKILSCPKSNSGVLNRLFNKILKFSNNYGNKFYPVNHLEQLKRTKVKQVSSRNAENKKTATSLDKLLPIAGGAFVIFATAFLLFEVSYFM